MPPVTMVNQIIEYDNDGVPRTITVVSTGQDRLTFTPALPSNSVAFKMLDNWDLSTDPTENFRLTETSPVIDAGTNFGVSAVDLDGLPRISRRRQRRLGHHRPGCP